MPTLYHKGADMEKINYQKRWKEIETESQSLTKQLKDAEYLFYTVDDQALKSEIMKNMSDVKSKLEALRVEASHINDVALELINQGVLI